MIWALEGVGRGEERDEVLGVGWLRGMGIWGIGSWGLPVWGTHTKRAKQTRTDNVDVRNAEPTQQLNHWLAKPILRPAKTCSMVLKCRHRMLSETHSRKHRPTKNECIASRNWRRRTQRSKAETCLKIHFKGFKCVTQVTLPISTVPWAVPCRAVPWAVPCRAVDIGACAPKPFP